MGTQEIEGTRKKSFPNNKRHLLCRPFVSFSLHKFRFPPFSLPLVTSSEKVLHHPDMTTATPNSRTKLIRIPFDITSPMDRTIPTVLEEIMFDEDWEGFRITVDNQVKSYRKSKFQCYAFCVVGLGIGFLIFWFWAVLFGGFVMIYCIVFAISMPCRLSQIFESVLNDEICYEYTQKYSIIIAFYLQRKNTIIPCRNNDYFEMHVTDTTTSTTTTTTSTNDETATTASTVTASLRIVEEVDDVSPAERLAKMINQEDQIK